MEWTLFGSGKSQGAVVILRVGFLGSPVSCLRVLVETRDGDCAHISKGSSGAWIATVGVVTTVGRQEGVGTRRFTMGVWNRKGERPKLYGQLRGLYSKGRGE